MGNLTYFLPTYIPIFTTYWVTTGKPHITELSSGSSHLLSDNRHPSIQWMMVCLVGGSWFSSTLAEATERSVAPTLSFFLSRRKMGFNLAQKHYRRRKSMMRSWPLDPKDGKGTKEAVLCCDHQAVVVSFLPPASSRAFSAEVEMALLSRPSPVWIFAY
jgi:hypothetical protein